jgi:hypothetical protein
LTQDPKPARGEGSVLDQQPTARRAYSLPIDHYFIPILSPVSLPSAAMSFAVVLPCLEKLYQSCVGLSGAAPKFTLNRLHHMDTARYFARSKSPLSA